MQGDKTRAKLLIASCNTSCPKTLDVLSRDRDEMIRFLIAINRGTLTSTLDALARDPVEMIRDLATEHLFQRAIKGAQL